MPVAERRGRGCRLRLLRRTVLLLLLVLILLPSIVRGQEAPSASPVDSLTVNRAVSRALDTYPTVEAARRLVDAEAAQIKQARSGYLPRISAVGTYRRQDPVPEVSVPSPPTAPTGSGGDIGIQPNNLYDGHLQLRQTLYDFGKTGARVDQAEAGRAAAERRVAIERTELAFQVIQAFYASLLAEARVDVQREQIDQLNRTLSVVRQQQDAGTATAFEVQSTQTRLSAARSQLTAFRSQRERQEAELHRLLSRTADAPVPLRGSIEPSLSIADTTRIDPDALAARAVAEHPSVKVAKAEVRAAQQQVRVADRSNTPTLQLEAQGGVKNGYPGDLNEPRLNESVGISLTVPLFDGFASHRRVEEVRARVDAAEARLTDVRRQIRTQVEQAASDLKARLDRLASTRLRVQQARRAAELARTRYDAGTITNLELLEAETALQEARLERTEVRYQVVMGRYALQRATGTLLPLDESSL